MFNKKVKLIHGVVLLCLAVLFTTTHRTSAEKDGLLKVYFLSVGQGDAEFIETPNGSQILIDGGPDNAVLAELGKIMPVFDRDIDLMVASHPHADHIAGLIQVLDRYEVAHIVQSYDLYDSAQFRVWQEAVNTEGADLQEAIGGKVFDFGDGVTLSVIWPLISYDGIPLKKPHEANATVMLQYKDVRILFTGDMETPAERALIQNGVDLTAQILKVGHHGSKTSTSQEFLDAVNPEVAFIEVGKNNTYHLPYPPTLTRLDTNGIPYYRTDEDGTMKVISDGEQYQITSAW